MPRFNPEPPFRHGNAPKVGVLLVNLGTPDAPTPSALRRYLKEFLSDPRVVEIPRLVWWPILNGMILNTRPKKSALKYASVWDREGSPLAIHTQRQAKLLRGYLGQNRQQPIEVLHAMRYGNPSIRSRIAALHDQGCTRILVVPLYPQYSAATSATVCDEAFRVLSEMRAQPTLRVAPPYYRDRAYIDALAASITAHLATLPFEPERIVASFHGMPQAYIDRGDPYQSQCQATTEALRKKLGLDENRLLITFQSRFGYDQWLQPYTDKTIEGLAKEGIKRLAVVMPGFASDCLETLEEIAQENAELFLHNGGEHFSAVPCLNDSDGGIAVIRQLVLRELQGWL